MSRLGSQEGGGGSDAHSPAMCATRGYMGGAVRGGAREGPSSEIELEGGGVQAEGGVKSWPAAQGGLPVGGGKCGLPIPAPAWWPPKSGCGSWEVGGGGRGSSPSWGLPKPEPLRGCPGDPWNPPGEAGAADGCPRPGLAAGRSAPPAAQYPRSLCPAGLRRPPARPARSLGSARLRSAAAPAAARCCRRVAPSLRRRGVVQPFLTSAPELGGLLEPPSHTAPPAGQARRRGGEGGQEAVLPKG